MDAACVPAVRAPATSTLKARALERLDLELGDLRAAIAFSLTQPDPAPGLRLVASLRAFWMS
jgi:hypothetical protein